VLIQITPIHLGLLNALLAPEAPPHAGDPRQLPFRRAHRILARVRAGVGLMNEYGPTGSNHPTYRKRKADER
jgi:hypothetical protein